VADKEVKITAKIEGGDSSNDEYQAQLEAAIKLMNDAGRAAKSADEAIEDLLKSVSFSTQPAEDMGEGSRRGGSRAGAGRPGVPKPPKFVKAPPMPGDGDGNDPDENLAKKKTRLGKALTALQKVVTAVDGTNGRTTKTLAVVNRGYQALSSALGKQQQASQAATASNTAQATTGATAAANTGKAGAATARASVLLKGLGATLGVAAGVAAGFTVALIAASVAAKILIRVIDNLQEVAGQFSMVLNKARAETQIATMQAQMRAAGRVGGDLSALEGVKKDLMVGLTEMKSEVVELLEPFFTLVGDSLTTLIELLNIILAVLNIIKDGTEYIGEGALEILSHIPVIGKAAGWALAWMQKDEIDKVKASDMNLNVEQLFKEENVFSKKPGKKSIQRRYLP
jgi:hypothetical protein